MGRCSFKMPEDFLLKVSRLNEKTDEILPRVLEAGGQVVLERVKSNLSAVVGKGTKVPSRSTGELESALGISPAKPKRDGSGWDIKVGFAEPRSATRSPGDGNSNAKIANIFEYGRHGQPPKPFLKPAKTQSRKACVETMKSKLDEEVRKI